MDKIPVIHVGDLLELKKAHPCGTKIFKIARVGSDIKIVCTGCSRSLTIERVKIEKMIKKIIPGGNENEQF